MEGKDVLTAGELEASSALQPPVLATQDAVAGGPAGAEAKDVATTDIAMGSGVNEPPVVEMKDDMMSSMSGVASSSKPPAVESEVVTTSDLPSGSGIAQRAMAEVDRVATNEQALKSSHGFSICPACGDGKIVDDIVLPSCREPEFEECIHMLKALTHEQQRAVKGLLGTAIGDSVGLPFELGAHVKNRKRLDQIVSWRSAPHKHEKVRVQEFLMFVYGERMSRAEGTPFGRTYSDDTVCTDLKMQAVAATWKDLESDKDISIEVAAQHLFVQVMGQYLVWAHGSDGQLFQGYGRFTEDLLRPKEGNVLGEKQQQLRSKGSVLWHASPAGSKITPSRQYLEFADSYFGGESGDASGGGSWGNGAVMSFTPGVILSRSPHAGALSGAARELARTHRHRTANIGAALLAELLEQIHAGKVANCSAIPQAVLRCPSWEGAVQPLLTEPCNYMHPISAFSAFLNDCCLDEQLAAANEFVNSLHGTCRVSGEHRFDPLGEAFRVASNMDDNMVERLTVKGNPDELVRFSQRGLNSVLIAIWCAVGATNCWDWLEKILYVGGDSDTVGAVAGQIACPLLDTGDVIENFKKFVAVDDSFLSILHRSCSAAARRYLHRAILFASGNWVDMLNVPRLVDPYYEGITEQFGLRLLGVQRAQCSHGESCTESGILHKDRFAHPGDDDYELAAGVSTKRKRPEGAKAGGDILRVRCKHGTRCFDKSRRHREAFAHPGDPDYEFSVYDKAAAQRKRKSCKHGHRCWDRSASHRDEFSHPGDPDYAPQAFF